MVLERAWLEKNRGGGDRGIGYAAHHAQHHRGQKEPANIAVYPVFRHPPNTIAMMAHTMSTCEKATRHINPTQVPVLAVDQPLYALCKLIQFLQPAKYGEGKFFIMFGSLHLEMNALKLLGEWLENSGWTEALVRAKVTTQGRAESMITASHVLRTRHAHEVS